jgi:hypothetical protein
MNTDTITDGCTPETLARALTRRSFLGGTAAALGALTAWPGNALALQEDAPYGQEKRLFYPLRLPGETNADLRELISAPTMVDL